MNKFKDLMSRGIVDVNQDMEDPIRREFDMAVMDAFGIGDYLDNIINSLKAMRKIRKAVKNQIINLKEQDNNVKDDIHDKMFMFMAAEE